MQMRPVRWNWGLPVLLTPSRKKYAQHEFLNYDSPNESCDHAETSAEETPQSVSVATRKRMDEHNLTAITDALKASVGMSKFHKGIGTQSSRQFNAALIMD